MTNAVGTLAWARNTGGTLNVRERMAIMSQAASTQIIDILRQTPLSGSNNYIHVDIDSIRVPDSLVSQQAIMHCETLSNASLVNHCMRTYMWAAILAQADGITYDEELLFVASALHDLGLTDIHNGIDPDAHCYAVEGASAAAAFVQAQGWDDERRDRLQETITMHLNVEVGLEHGAEAHLLHDGAALDVIGLRYHEIAPETIARVVARHPRLDFKAVIARAFQTQIAMRPGSRITFLHQTAQFGMRVKYAPFED